MFTRDLFFVIEWWFYLLLIGLIFYPITKLIFINFFDRGYIFSKTIGIALISYFIYIFSTLHILRFERVNIAFILIIVIFTNLVLYKNRTIKLEKKDVKIVFFEELLFLVSLLFWSYIKGFQPDIHGLEKFMDFGFMNSILRSDYFPPTDMWFPPNSINYYYFGHLVTAVLMKITNITPIVSYNLMLATIFAFTATSAFSIVSTVSNLVFKSRKTAILSGILAGTLLVFGGNLQTIYSFFSAYQPPDNPVPPWQLKFQPFEFPNNYWYPNATRFIPFTIHEFPSYSFVVSDLHGHVLDIPFVMLTIALILLIFINKKLNLKLTVAFSFMLAIMYMTNAWDGIIYLGLFSFSVLVINFSLLKRKKITEKKENSLRGIFGWDLVASIFTGITSFITTFLHSYGNKKEFLAQSIKYIALTCMGYFIFSLPFNLSFSPFVSGIGVLCAPEFLTKIGKIGPLIFEVDHCQKTPLWMFVVLYSFFYIFAIALFFKILKHKKLTPPLTFLLILIFFSTALIIIPEFIYAKDIYPQHYRANTVFKFTYQAYIMLTIASSFAITFILKNGRKYLWIPIILVLLTINLSYSYFAIKSYFADLKDYKTLDGLAYVKALHPGTYEAIHWIQENIKGNPVILESQGDSYTDYGIISSNTGLPTVLGWTVHEWLWRGDYSYPAARLDDVRSLYEDDIPKTENLIKKYNIEYVYIGSLERTKYPLLNENKFDLLGKIVYQNETVKIYKL